MDKKLEFTGGEPDVRLNQITIDDAANRPGMFGMMKAFERIAGNFTIDGCVVTVGGSSPNNTWDLTAGYILLNSEMVQVDAQSGIFDSLTQFLAFSKVVTYDTRGDKTFIDGNPRQTWQVNRGVVNVQGSVSGTELDAIDGDRLSKMIDFKRDIISAVQTSATVDFSTDEDLIQVDISAIPAGTVAITVENIINGDDTKYIEITSSVEKIVTFTGATDISKERNIIPVGVPVVYETWNKNGVVFVKSLRVPETREKLIEIGDWNMANSTVSFNHNLTYANIVGIESVLIRNDADSSRSILYGSGDLGQLGGTASFNSTQVTLVRTNSGAFDTGGYVATSYNRGWVILKYTI